MSLNEADTRAKLIDPALHERGWREDWIRRELTPGPFVRTGAGYERGPRRADYVLHLPIQGQAMPVAVVEAKAEDASPDAGIEQAKRDARLHSVRFAFATNGHQFHETDLGTNATRGPLPFCLPRQRRGDVFPRHRPRLPNAPSVRPRSRLHQDEPADPAPLRGLSQAPKARCATMRQGRRARSP